MRAHGWMWGLPGGGPAGSAGVGVEEAEGQGLWLLRLRFQVHAYEQMRACVCHVRKTLRFMFAGLCASRVGAAEPVRTDVAPLDGTMGQGWRSASLVTVEDEAPALDTVVVDPQGALDTNVQVASESESAGVHCHCQCRTR